MLPILNLDSTVPSLPTLPSTQMIPSVPDQPPLEILPEIFVAASQPHNGREVTNYVRNYYFLILALLTAVLSASLWWLHRQRRRAQDQTKLRGHNSLVRVERWAYNRRNQPPVVEGLNEAGEAPPPYKLKDVTVTT
ncbi:hypothetical protein ST47_g5122 [Ascochyta rabiei]|uniref:Uncharacterized protein n=1 Tax=Didymella rabiei TaxID=5454 RepID=A0A163EIE7_DIDRA|nr:hypothetical protein ST47_g5122 [Ascochyta rabiei]